MNKQRNPIPKLKAFWDASESRERRAEFIAVVFGGKFSTAYSAVHGLRPFKAETAVAAHDFFASRGISITCADIRPDLWARESQAA